MNTYHEPLLPGKVYHVFNHAVGSELLFREDSNFSYFLERYQDYIAPVCRTFSYALLPNHFHFAIQVRTENELKSLLLSTNRNPDEVDLSKYVMQQFSNFCNAYAKAYNKRYRRRGALFIDYLRRRMVTDAVYFRQLIVYHHFNPVLHHICSDLKDYPFTSYHDHMGTGPTLLQRDIVLARFGGIEAFKERHQRYNVRTEDFDFDVDFGSDLLT